MHRHIYLSWYGLQRKGAAAPAKPEWTMVTVHRADTSQFPDFPQLSYIQVCGYSCMCKRGGEEKKRACACVCVCVRVHDCSPLCCVIRFVSFTFRRVVFVSWPVYKKLWTYTLSHTRLHSYPYQDFALTSIHCKQSNKYLFYYFNQFITNPNLTTHPEH